MTLDDVSNTRSNKTLSISPIWKHVFLTILNRIVDRLFTKTCFRCFPPLKDGGPEDKGPWCLESFISPKSRCFGFHLICSLSRLALDCLEPPKSAKQNWRFKRQKTQTLNSRRKWTVSATPKVPREPCRRSARWRV